MNPKRCVVLLSGGQDSTTCLFWAIENGYDVMALTINYGQRHQSEIDSAFKVREIAGIKDHMLYTLPPLPVKSALTNTKEDISSPHAINPDLPSSFVPGRNLLFLTLAASIAYSQKIKHIIIGVNETDFSGYPDCRSDTMRAMQSVLYLGLGSHIYIHTPLIKMTKSQICTVGYELGNDCVEALSHTTTCYNGSYPPCGVCPSCKIRAEGYKDAGLDDPLLMR